jgi:hypothetical protein
MPKLKLAGLPRELGLRPTARVRADTDAKYILNYPYSTERTRTIWWILRLF